MARPKGYVFTPLAERFDAKVDKSGDCWVWTGFVDKGGYARIRAGGRAAAVLYAHRFAYERFVGPIPTGLHIDHLCRNRACVNPAHMEPVTLAENTRRGVFPHQPNRLTGKCGRGHDHATEGYYKNGKLVYCRECRRIRRRADREAVVGASR